MKALRIVIFSAMRKLYALYVRFRMQMLYRRGTGSHILFWVPGGMPLMLHFEAAIAAALRARKHKVTAVICDGVFHACVRREVTDNIPVSQWKDLCSSCRTECSGFLHRMGIDYRYIGEFVPADSLNKHRTTAESSSWESLGDLMSGDVNIGKNVRSSLVRFLKGHEVPEVEVVQEYTFSGLVCAEASANALTELSPEAVFMSHGSYVDWGPMLHVALNRDIPVSAWMASYLPWRFYFRHIEDLEHIDFHNISRKAWNDARTTPLTALQQSTLQKFLQDRYRRNASFDMKDFNDYTGRAADLKKKYNLDPSRPIWGVLTHINWDAVSDYAPMLYESFNDWIRDTLKSVGANTDVQWMIKIHPAEAWDNPDSGIESLIKNEFPHLPDHIRVLKATEEINPLDFFELIDGAVTVYGTAGLELAVNGKPVILAGDAHYGSKGFTHDCSTVADYRKLLNDAALLRHLTDGQRALAEKYAYIYFIQRQIPVSVVQDSRSKWWSFRFDRRKLLRPGVDPAIDFICDRIVDGQDFIMTDALMQSAVDRLKEE